MIGFIGQTFLFSSYNIASNFKLRIYFLIRLARRSASSQHHRSDMMFFIYGFIRLVYLASIV